MATTEIDYVPEIYHAPQNHHKRDKKYMRDKKSKIFKTETNSKLYLTLYNALSTTGKCQ